jgi:hypothetical protein
MLSTALGLPSSYNPTKGGGGITYPSPMTALMVAMFSAREEYITWIRDKVLTYLRSIKSLIGYTDADWAEDRDIRRFTNNYIFLM